MVSDCGDRGLLTIWTRSLWIKIIFPFSLSPAKWISDYFDIKGCSANNSARAHRSSLRQWRCGQNSQRKLWTRFELADFFLVRAASLYAPNVQCVNKLARYKEEGLVWSASLFVEQIAFSFCWRERKRKYVSQWDMACSKQKWTSIATVPDLCPTTVKILTHIISRYHLPSSFDFNRSGFCGRYHLSNAFTTVCTKQ